MLCSSSQLSEILVAGPLNFDKAKEHIRKTQESLGNVADSLRETGSNVISNASDQASNLKQKLEDRKDDDPDPYDEAIAEYNAAFTAMSDKGMSLLLQRQRSTDLIDLVEMLVNSIANTPKSYETDFEKIEVHKKHFLASEDFAQKDLEAARKSATGVGVGFTAGATVASIAPTAAMWVATTFGTASTGTAISTLSGAAASKAALAWLGGGALAAGGGGTAAGSALIALAGPIGWSIAGAALLTSVVLFSKQKSKNRQAKDEELSALKENTAQVKGIATKISALLEETSSLRAGLMKFYADSLALYQADFLSLSEIQQTRLAALVNNTMSSAALLSKHVAENDEEQ